MTRAELIARLRALGSKRPAADKTPAAPALNDSEAQLRAVLQTAVEGIITIDEHGLVESLNPAAERMFGFEAEEIIGKSVNLLMPSPHRERHDAYLADYLRTGTTKMIARPILQAALLAAHQNYGVIYYAAQMYVHGYR